MTTETLPEYGARLEGFGHQILLFGTARIGRRTYEAMLFVSPERDALPGARCGQPAEVRMALAPTDGKPCIPPSYKRSSRTTYREGDGTGWYVAGWDASGHYLWLNDDAWMDQPGNVWSHGDRPTQGIVVTWDGAPLD